MLTHARHIELMQHALGKTPDSRHLLYDTYNQAGRALFTRYPWTWRTSQPTAFTFTGGASELALPVGCDVVQTVMPQDGIVTKIRVVTTEELIRYETQSRITTPDYLVATGEYAPGTTTNEPTRRVRIYPTPVANNLSGVTYTSASKTFTITAGGDFPKTFMVGATIAVVSGTGLTAGSYVITATTSTTIVIADSIGSGTPTDVILNIGGLETYIVYTRTWVDASSGTGSSVPKIPADYERALCLMARAFAMHVENQTSTIEDQASIAEINRLIALDIEKNPNVGAIRGDWNRANPDGRLRYPIASISLSAP